MIGKCEDVETNNGRTRPLYLSPEKPVLGGGAGGGGSGGKKQQLEPDMQQWTDSKLGKEYVKGVCCYPAYLPYMQSTS